MPFLHLLQLQRKVKIERIVLLLKRPYRDDLKMKMLLLKRTANLPDVDLHLRKIVFFLILCLGTILTYNRVDKYIENPEQLLTNPAFTDGLPGWQVDLPATASVTANPGFVRLQANEAQSSFRLSQTSGSLKTREKGCPPREDQDRRNSRGKARLGERAD